MIRISISVLFLLLATTWSICQSTTDKVVDVIESIINDEKAVGISAGTATNGKITWSHSQGESDKTHGTSFTRSTVCRTASITKPITAISIMQLVESGKLSLDDMAMKYIPELNDGPKKNITIRHLMQHASGIGAYKNNKEANNTKNFEDLQAVINKLAKRKLSFEPGSDFGYTSYGYLFLGRIIEKVSGLSYAQYVQKNVFDPLEMNNTHIEQKGVHIEGRAKIYHQSKPGKIREEKDHNISDRIPGGGMISSSDDLLKFAMGVLGNKLISAESLALMISDSGLKKEGNGYGMGWYLYGQNDYSSNIYGHNGAQYGCSSFLFLLPDINSAVVVLSNTSGVLKEVSNLAVSLFGIIDDHK